MKKQRLDKVLGHLGYGSRKEIKKIVKEGLVLVNKSVVRNASIHVMPTIDEIQIKGEKIAYRQYIYLMLNKPKGVISSTEDSRHKTVLDLIELNLQQFKPFPVGRLDKDTEGLLLLTNDGQLAHQLLSPKKHVAKTYFAHIDGEVTALDVQKFREGVVLEDNYHTLPSELIIKKAGSTSEVEVTIYEGKFHQVKRMFKAVGKEVIYLKRLKMGKLLLDENLPLGHCRELTAAELSLLK